MTTSGDDGKGPGETLLHDRYRLGAIVGTGGFSTVYRAHDMLDRRDVAIKQVTLRGLSAEEKIEATDTFNREVSLLSTLRHPQVPRIYDHFSDPEHWYLVLEYLEGTTLEAYLEKRTTHGKPLQIDEVLAMGLQLCSVLEYLHTHQPPVIFRDLKPGNIIRTPGGTLCLIDFGIARLFRPGQTRDTQPLGSPGYAAPEQYGKAQTTPQTDIYSLGALLHTLLSSQDPTEQLPGLTPLSLHATTGESELSALTQRMLSPDPRGRPATAHVVAATLKSIRQQRLAQAGGRIWQPPIPQALPPSMGGQHQIQVHLSAQSGQTTSSPAKRPFSRRGLLIGLGSSAASLAIGLTVGNIVWRSHPSSISPPGSPSFATAADFVYKGHSQPVNSVAWSPGGQRIASASMDTTVQVWDAANGGHVLTYRGHTASVNAVVWSPDGQWIASSGGDTVQVWDAASGAHVSTYRGHTFVVGAVAWSPDSRWIATGSLDNTVQVWNASTGKTALTYRGHRHSVNAVTWSPKGRWIASGSSDGTVQVWDAANGGPVFTYKGHTYIVNAVAWSPRGDRIVSGSDDYTAQVWDATTGGNAFTYQGHTGSVTAVAWSPHGKQIASASLDGTVQVWDAPGVISNEQ